jgi:hypothetical protein
MKPVRSPSLPAAVLLRTGSRRASGGRGGHDGFPQHGCMSTAGQRAHWTDWDAQLQPSTPAGIRTRNPGLQDWSSWVIARLATRVWNAPGAGRGGVPARGLLGGIGCQCANGRADNPKADARHVRIVRATVRPCCRSHLVAGCRTQKSRSLAEAAPQR